MAAPLSPDERFSRDVAVVTAQHQAAIEREEHLRERRRYGVAGPAELCARVASTFATGHYALPAFMGSNRDGTEGLLERVTGGTQTATVLTRDIGLGDGDCDSLPPERHTELPDELPLVSEFPMLSLPQQLEAEQRLTALLARIEQEVQRCAEAALRDARQQHKGPVRRGSDGRFCTTDEWENRMLGAITSRMRDRHRGLEEDASLTGTAGVMEAAWEAARHHRQLFERSDGRGPATAGQGDVPQAVTPAVQHVLKVRPLLRSSELERRGERAASPRRPQEQAQQAPLSRGMQIALSNQTFVTERELPNRSFAGGGRSMSFYGGDTLRGAHNGSGDFSLSPPTAHASPSPYRADATNRDAWPSVSAATLRSELPSLSAVRDEGSPSGGILRGLGRAAEPAMELSKRRQPSAEVTQRFLGGGGGDTAGGGGQEDYSPNTRRSHTQALESLFAGMPSGEDMVRRHAR